MAENENFPDRAALAPSPIDRIQCEVWAAPAGIRIRYVGAPADLVAAGAVEPPMVAIGRKGVRRLDSHGDKFRRSTRGGRMEFCRDVTSIERALELPGIDAERLREDVADILWLRQNPGRVRVDEEDSRFYILGSRADLEATGFAPSFRPNCYGDGWWPAEECLDGYFLVTVEKLRSAPNSNRNAIAAAESAVAASRNRSRPVIRLVVDNDGPNAAGVAAKATTIRSIARVAERDEKTKAPENLRYVLVGAAIDFDRLLPLLESVAADANADEEFKRRMLGAVSSLETARILVGHALCPP